jgi:endogenous inhibitor of DNA gyrase (YacG/DUF329 family)
MNKPDMLYINCKYCGAKIPTGFAMSKTTQGTVLRNNTSGPCPKCGKMTTWDGEDAFYEDGTPFISK